MIAEINIQCEDGRVTCGDNKEVLNIESKCAICHNEYSGVDVIIKTWCDHTFHKGCMVLWLWENNKCPLCRREVYVYPKKKETTYHPIIRELRTRKYPIYTWITIASLFLVLSVAFWIAMERPTLVERRDISINALSQVDISSICLGSFVTCDGNIINTSNLTLIQELDAFCESGTFRCFATQNRAILSFVLYGTPLISTPQYIIILWRFVMPGLCGLLIALSCFNLLIHPKLRYVVPYLFTICSCVITMTECIKELILVSPYI